MERLKIIQKELFNHQINMNKSLENKIVEVLVENENEKDYKFFGRTEYMTSVIFEANKQDIGKIISIKIINSNQNTLFGKKVENLN